MAEVLLQEKTQQTKTKEEVFVPFQQLWDLSRREHEELQTSGFLHFTGHPRFPKPQPENQGKYSKMFSDNACFFVVSSQGLIFFGCNLRVIEKRKYKLVPIETIKGARISSKIREINPSDIAKRKKDPLCVL